MEAIKAALGDKFDRNGERRESKQEQPQSECPEQEALAPKNGGNLGESETVRKTFELFLPLRC